MEQVSKNICVNSFQFIKSELTQLELTYKNLTGIVGTWLDAGIISSYDLIFFDKQLTTYDEATTTNIGDATYTNFLNSLNSYNESSIGYFYLFSLMYRENTNDPFNPQALIGYLNNNTNLFEYFQRNDSNTAFQQPFIFKVKDLPIKLNLQNGIVMETPEFTLTATPKDDETPVTPPEDDNIEPGDNTNPDDPTPNLGKSKRNHKATTMTFDQWCTQQGYKTLDHNEINTPYILPYDQIENNYDLIVAPYACFKLTFSATH